MKKSYIILLAICLTFVVSGCAEQTGNSDTTAVSSESAVTADTGGFVFTDGAKAHMISENGAYITTLDSLPETVIKSAEEFIINSNCNDPSFEFVFENSPKFGSPEGIALSFLDYFEPTVFERQEDGSPFYVSELTRGGVYIGYFVVNNNGEIIEHNVITKDQYSEIDSEYNIDMPNAMSDLANHFSIPTENLKSLCRYLDKTDNKYTLCYRGIFLSDDKTKKYYARMNGETGEIFYTAEFELIDGTWQLIQEQS